MCGLVHISNFESIGVWKVQSNPICLSIIYLVHQTLACSLTTIGRQQCYTDQIIDIILPCWYHDWYSRRKNGDLVHS